MTGEIKKGDPTALGVFAYGFSLFVLSLYAAGMFPWSESIMMIAVSIGFGGIFLLTASIWEYNNGNTFGATAFGTYSAFFLVFGLAHIGLKLSWFTAVPVGHLIGMMALSFVIMTLIYTVASLKMTKVHFLMLFVLLWVFVLYAIPLLTLNAAGTTTAFGAFSASNGTNPSLMPAGWVGIIDALITFYLGGSVVINDRWEKAGFSAPLPLLPFKPKAQVKKVETPSTH